MRDKTRATSARLGARRHFRADAGMSAGASFPRFVLRSQAGTPRGKILREDCLRLVSLLVKREVWVQLVADRTMVPDESRVVLRIAYGTDSVEIWEWYDSQETAGRIAEIRELMKDIAWQDRKKTYGD